MWPTTGTEVHRGRTCSCSTTISYLYSAEVCTISKISIKEVGCFFKLILKDMETSVDLITTADFKVTWNTLRTWRKSFHVFLFITLTWERQKKLVWEKLPSVRPDYVTSLDSPAERKCVLFRNFVIPVLWEICKTKQREKRKRYSQSVKTSLFLFSLTHRWMR